MKNQPAQPPMRSRRRQPVAFGVALGVTAVLMLSACEGLGSDADEFGAFVMCQEFIEDRLKAPGTADYPALSSSTWSKTGENKWRIHSYVDAENSFGANVRSYFECEVEYEGDERWRLLNLTLDE